MKEEKPLDLNLRIDTVKGVGEKKADLFKKLKIFTIYDLLNYFPVNYLNLANVKKIGELKPEKKVGFYGEVKSISQVGSKANYSRKLTWGANKSMINLEVFDETGIIRITFFNSPYLLNYIKENEQFFFFGDVVLGNFGLSVANPMHFKADSAFKPHILPIYRLTKGLSNIDIRKVVKAQISPQIADFLDINEVNSVLRKRIGDHAFKNSNFYNYENLDFAIKNLHFPQNKISYLSAKRRIIFDEFLILLISMNYYKNSKNKKNKPYDLFCEDSEKVDSLDVKNENNSDKSYYEEFINLLPFQLTTSQEKILRDIENDLSSKEVMNRLIQGDVSSGKTILAIYACFLAYKNNYQSAILVPTYFLAIQHFNTFTEIFKNTKIKVSLLISSLKTKEKNQVKKEIENGKANIIIGTTSIVSDEVDFKNLNLIVFDEQHKFGVTQKELLTKKSNEVMNILTMSATPIPRTLTHSLFGKLNTSILDEKPKNRKSIKTFALNEEEKNIAYEKLISEVSLGHQCIVVSPIINDTDFSEENDLKSVKSLFESFNKNYGIPNNINAALLHGELSSDKKNKIINDFFNNKINVLISTTLIEVGIDSKLTTLIIIENADRFGLSTLHQLRGRVGRGDKESFCYLVSNSKDNKRLDVLSKTDDGFVIAKSDLNIRGGGDFLGIRQSGLFNFKFANLEIHKNIFSDARYICDKILKKDKLLKHKENVKLKEKIVENIKNEH